jgi:hypothetical protein
MRPFCVAPRHPFDAAALPNYKEIVMLRVLNRLLLALLLVVPTAAIPQNADNSNPQSTAALKPEELDALVAPIALYPDPLLSLVLMASTYPLEIVQAERWLADNGNLSQDQLKAAVDKQPGTTASSPSSRRPPSCRR